MERDAEVSQTATRQSRQSVIHSFIRSFKRVQGIITECSGEADPFGAESSERDCYAEENDNMNMQ